ncbi:MAG: hypothetical protein HWD62_02325 [Cyclobacteriaceae bacterium]|nr:MAG: hypothetical protein HWD62_02325 [Cyclobacteriaceae bacterium]
MACISGKRSYLNTMQAEEALLQAHIQFNYRAGTGPVTYYKCEDCGDYHLTSQGVMHPTLANAIRNGTIKKQKEADSWSDKFKGR